MQSCVFFCALLSRRFWLGFGIGGDYPLSATIMSEYANKKTRGAFIAAVFAMQGFGILGGATVSIVVSAAFRNAFDTPIFTVDPVGSTPPQADYVWRIIFMLGALPAACTFYYRMKMPETARYTALVAHNNKRAALDMGRVLQVDFTNINESNTLTTTSEQLLLLLLLLHHHHHTSNSRILWCSRACTLSLLIKFHTLLWSSASYIYSPESSVLICLIFFAEQEYGLFTTQFAKRHGLQLLGTTSTWFLLDIAFYSQNLFQKDIFTAIGWLPSAKSMNALEEVFRISRAQALIALCSTVPGYWFTVAFIDIVGRWIIQLMGFFFMTLFMLILALDYYPLRGQACPKGFCGGNHITFVVLYAFTFFFANFGPNATTFIVPAELFPARLRSTCHGISAACGKAGAIVGAFGFLYAAQGQHPGEPDPGYPTGIGVKNSFIGLAVINGIGFLMTFLVPETKGRSLEDLSGENEAAKEPSNTTVQSA